MTTVDVDVRRLGGSESISLHNGLFGPATTLFHAAIEACKNGSATGEWGGSHARVTVSGRALRAMMADVERLEPPYHDAGDDQGLADFRRSIDDHAEYVIDALEF